MARYNPTAKPPRATTAITTDIAAPAVDAAPWQASHGQYLAGRAALDDADALALEMERRWGVGRLRLLVPVELREKFDRQRYLLNQAIWYGDLEAVRLQARRMCAAWRAADAAATAAGAAHLAPTVWEAATPDGAVVAVVRDNADGHAVLAEGRALTVYTMQEVARMLAAFPALAAVKAAISGATVEAARQITDPLDGVHVTHARGKLDDEIPF
jgi:hypothetical protein